MLKEKFNQLAARSGMTGQEFESLFGGAARMISPERADYLSEIIDCLEGAYTPSGIKKWFNRARAQLAGKSPREILEQPWSPEGKAQQQILGLARALRS